MLKCAKQAKEVSWGPVPDDTLTQSLTGYDTHKWTLMDRNTPAFDSYFNNS